MSKRGFVVWFTGLSGSGKSTLAAMLAAELASRGVHVETLDGDEVRMHLSKGLTFSKEDRDTNVRRIGFVAKLIARSGGCAITAAISPYRDIRAEQRRAADGRFCEVYCSCPVDALALRDAKGLYKKALAGEIKNFTGVDDPYEAPENPEVVVRTDRESKEESLAKIVGGLEALGYIHASAAAIRGTKDEGETELVLPHGGELVDRWVRGDGREGLVEKAKSLAAVTLDQRGAADVENIAAGAFSPLKGFMTSKEYLRVVREMRLENGLVWPFPVTLAVPLREAASIGIGDEVALRMPDGRDVAILDVSDKFSPDKGLEAREVYRTTEDKHPGVAYLKGSGNVYLGGEIRVLERPTAPEFPVFHRDPAATRNLFRERGWSTVVGFQTRNPMHRAHEYITKCALEICDGLMIHPLVGATQGGDIPARVRMKCYEALLASYYPKEGALLSVYPAAMRYGGPREALLHALARKNYGCSHFIVGRDHAGIGGYYAPRAAREIFARFSPSELGMTPLFFEKAFYSKAMSAMATTKTAPGDPGAALELSGTEVRELVRAGKVPPPELSRPEVARILIDEAAKSPVGDIKREG
ncbi:MAG TPA: sulfate adenylyltransferase [Polyangiaceae bacterium]|nr:sulfate adenylyltransferase [Polyangiaceae bacterium]